MQPPGHESNDGETELARRLRAGDHHAVGEVFAGHEHRLNAIARRMGMDGAADDVVQETFILLWEHPDRFDPQRGSLSSYLTTTSRGRALDLLRRDAARRGREERSAVGDAVTYTHVEDDGLRRTLRERLERALADLPVRQREPIALAYFANLTYEEVALVLDRPVGTVKSRIRSGLRTMGDTLGGEWRGA
ncbi:MAG: RNA polymerase sigma factor [Acidimicrobiia bacterium]|nr:RNA polymerase sigma factor [Acidimicrobiia bacterium]